MILRTFDGTTTLRLINPFTEADALYLQHVCVEPGIHHITTETPAKYREVLSSLINSFPPYHDIACLSLEPQQHHNTVVDLATVLMEQGCLTNPTTNMLEFFLDAFYYDFLWIELSDEMLVTTWYQLFDQYLYDFNFSRSMPILKVSWK